MGMPNAYKCDVCTDVYFDGTSAGEHELRQHYREQHPGVPVPDDINAYKCHDTNCSSGQKYAPDARLMVEHYRTEH